MENSYEDMDIVLSDFKDFLIKNDAELPEGQTFELIVDTNCVPLIAKWKDEMKAMVMNAIKYLEEEDEQMHEVSKNILNFYKILGEKYDQNWEKLKTTEMNYKLSLAKCGDDHDDQLADQEKELEGKIDEMKKAIHHVELNEKLESCFAILDKITLTYRSYDTEYQAIVNNYPSILTQFYTDFEMDSATIFKLYPESARDKIWALFEKETAERQAQAEIEARKQWEETKRLEELKAAEEEKANPAAAGSKKKAAPAPAKAGKKDEPPYQVPKIEIP